MKTRKQRGALQLACTYIPRSFRTRHLATRTAIAYIERGDTARGLEQVRSRLGPSFPGLFATMDELVTELIGQRCVDDAVDVSLDVISRGGAIYSKTLTKIAAALLDSDRYEAAKDFIAAAAKGLSTGTAFSDSIRIVWHLDKSGDIEKVTDMTEFLLANGLLRREDHWTFSGLVNVHLNNGDLGTALDTFEQLVEKHKVLPMSAHLFRALIKAGDMEKMQRLIDSCASIESDQGAIYYRFALHLLEMGEDSAAENLLKTPGLRYNRDTVTDVCNRLAVEGNLEGLRKFNAFTKDVFGMDRQIVYTRMIVAAADDLPALTNILRDMRRERIPLQRNAKNIAVMAFRSADQPIPKASK